MRLICPNCGAQYEVPDSVIPESGRDVQCSSCGSTWFQRHPLHAGSVEAEESDLSGAGAGSAPSAPPQDHDTYEDDDTFSDADAFDEDEDEDDDSADDEWQGFPADPGLTDAAQPGTRLVPDPDDPVSRLPDVAEDDYEEDPARDLPSPRRSLDTSVADMLREEAEREARARAAERSAGLESQPDLGLDSGPSIHAPASPQPDRDALLRSEQVQLRMARLRGDDPAAPADPPRQPIPTPQPAAPATDDDQIAAAAAAAVADSRRGLLPDIEEINSSLRSTSDRRPARADDHDTPGHVTDPAKAHDASPRGFSRGFSVTLLIAVILLALYIFAPALVEALPAAGPTMDIYVAAVDDLRIMLDAQMQRLSHWLAEIAGSTG